MIIGMEQSAKILENWRWPGKWRCLLHWFWIPFGIFIVCGPGVSVHQIWSRHKHGNAFRNL